MENLSQMTTNIPEWVHFVVLLIILGAGAIATKKRLDKKKEELK